jgi:hypothetical protein
MTFVTSNERKANAIPALVRCRTSGGSMTTIAMITQRFRGWAHVWQPDLRSSDNGVNDIASTSRATVFGQNRAS